MEKDKRFPEQDAPNKNTDKAFVKVSEDGSPNIPKDQKEEKKELNEPPKEKSRH